MTSATDPERAMKYELHTADRASPEPYALASSPR